MRTVAAGLAYAAIVFAIGFVLGALRVMAIAPAIGALPATLLELPLMLAASFFVAGWLVRRLAVAPRIPTRLLMGVVGFTALIALETLLGLALGRSLDAQLTSLATAAGSAGLLGQVAFGLIPALRLAAHRS